VRGKIEIKVSPPKAEEARWKREMNLVLAIQEYFYSLIVGTGFFYLLKIKKYAKGH
jgi:hypothetical protein